jgi:hypothetical protein
MRLGVATGVAITRGFQRSLANLDVLKHMVSGLQRITADSGNANKLA